MASRSVLLLLLGVASMAVALQLATASHVYEDSFDSVEDFDLQDELDVFDSEGEEFELHASESWEGEASTSKKRKSSSKRSGTPKRSKTGKTKAPKANKLGRDKCVLPPLGAMSAGTKGYTALDPSNNAYSTGTPCGNLFRKSFNGCGPESLQKGTDFFQSVKPTAKWTKRLEAACNAHDICYTCGEHGKQGQVHCDAAMAKNTAQICSTLFGGGKDPAREKKCVTWAKRFHTLVAKFGGPVAYSPKQCHSSWKQYGSKPFLIEEGGGSEE